MKRLLVILTGGTIASGFGGQKSKSPQAETALQLKESLEKFFEDRQVEALFRMPFGVPGVDSSEIDPGHWLTLSRCISDELPQGLSGVLILHGTDTMANTAAWLSLCFGNLPIPIVLTGSQLTLDYMTEDVTTNMRGAAMACFSNIRGVWIYFNWKLIPGDRAHKAHAMHPDAFTAINGQPMFFNPHWALETTQSSNNRADRPMVLPEVYMVLGAEPDELRRRVKGLGWVFVQPGVEPWLRGDETMLCLVGYGAGNASPMALEAIERCYQDRPKPLIVACSHAEGGVKHPDGYGRVGMASLTLKGFRLWSQMDRSLAFVHSLCCYAMAAMPQDPGLVLSRYLQECKSI